jgi:recombination protein RecT
MDDFKNVQIYTGEELAKPRSTLATVRDLMVSKRGQIAALMPKHMDANRLMRIALLTMRGNKDLLKCTPESLLGAILQAAQLGLEPGDALGQAYLVPYRNKKNGVMSATFQMGYQGMIDLAKRSGEVRRITAHVVYEKDEFEYEYGLNERLVHKPNHEHKKKPIAVYAVAHFKDESHAFEVLSIDEVEAARNTGKQGDSPAWRNHWPAMARKTAIRRLFKYLPISIEMSKAIALDEAGDAGIDQHLDLQLSTNEELTEVIVVRPVEPEKPKKQRKPRSGKGKSRKKADTDTDTDTDVEPETKPDPVGDAIKANAESSDEFNPIEELYALADQLWGPTAGSHLAKECEAREIDLSQLTEQEASSMIDVLTEKLQLAQNQDSGQNE